MDKRPAGLLAKIIEPTVQEDTPHTPRDQNIFEECDDNDMMFWNKNGPACRSELNALFGIVTKETGGTMAQLVGLEKEKVFVKSVPLTNAGAQGEVFTEVLMDEDAWAKLPSSMTIMNDFFGSDPNWLVAHWGDSSGEEILNMFLDTAFLACKLTRSAE